MEISDSKKNKETLENLQEDGEEKNQINPNEIEEKLEKKVKQKTKNENKENNVNKYIFNNLIKIKNEKSSQKLLDEQWHHQKILLDYNILDFARKNY